MKLTLDLVKANPRIQDYISQTQHYLTELGFTDHGMRHINIVSERSRSIARKIGLSAREQELVGIAAYCHDMGNFLGRTQHHYWAALLFSQVFGDQAEDPNEVSTIAQAIVCHDKNELKLVNRMTAVLVIADKSDVHRSRVRVKPGSGVMLGIHDRVNYAVIDNDLLVDNRKKLITLKMKLDTKFSAPLEYFEIFTDRMTYCRLAADYIGYKFGLEINKFKLL